jgi:hypothetical protein
MGSFTDLNRTMEYAVIGGGQHHATLKTRLTSCCQDHIRAYWLSQNASYFPAQN